MYQLGIIGLIRVTAWYGPDIIGSVVDVGLKTCIVSATQPSTVMDDSRLSIRTSIKHDQGSMYPKFTAVCIKFETLPSAMGRLIPILKV